MAAKKNAKGKKKAKDSKAKTKSGKYTTGKDGVSPTPTPPAPIDADPPIIISGGSVKIASSVFLDVSYNAATSRFIYSTSTIKIGKIKTKGKKDQEDDSDGGKFTIELFNE